MTLPRVAPGGCPSPRDGSMPRRGFLARVAAAAVVPVLGPGRAGAAPRSFRVVPAASVVRLRVQLGQGWVNGQVPLVGGHARIDPRSPAGGSFDVTLDTGRARGDSLFATEALRGRSLLDAAAHPRARFVSQSLRPAAAGAISVAGLLTLRGITRPVVLLARLSDADGVAPPGDRALRASLQGSVRRGDFGATGWAGVLGETVLLEVSVLLEPIG